MSDYNEIIEQVRDVTDPDGERSIEIALMALAEADPAMNLIIQLRQAICNYESIMEGDEHPHAVILKRKTEADVEMIKDQIGSLMEAYAKGVERILKCSCHDCLAAAAKNN